MTTKRRLETKATKQSKIKCAYVYGLFAILYFIRNFIQMFFLCHAFSPHTNKIRALFDFDVMMCEPGFVFLSVSLFGLVSALLVLQQHWQ